MAGNLIHAAFIDHPHIAERLPAGAQNGAAQRENTGELLFAHLLIFTLDQPAIAVADTDNFRVKKLIGGTRHAADGRIQAGQSPPLVKMPILRFIACSSLSNNLLITFIIARTDWDDNE